MRPVTLFLVVFALAVAGLTAFLAKRFLDQNNRPVAAERVLEPAKSVLVTARDVVAGTALASADVKWQSWPVDGDDTRFLVKAEGSADPLAAAIGQHVRRPLAAGEPIRRELLFKPGQAGVMAGMLTPGARAVAISIGANNAASGFILPGDRVDVVLTADLSRLTGATQPQPGIAAKFAAETILTDIRVLAIDQAVKPGQATDTALVGKIALLEVTPDQAEQLATAGMMGALSLSLRSLAVAQESAPATGRHYTSDTSLSKALSAYAGGRPQQSGGGSGIRVNRGGKLSVEGN
ncbi:MAG: Flp pilus assembly protein CpaB [Alphaproteobacteria bacterium]|nr:Flp pilus assembly protein CpaB [Alphaproteobacteria bacterium]